MDFRTHVELLSKEVNLTNALGGQYLLDKRNRTCRVPFSRSATVYEPQADGTLAAYTGSQVPWGPKGVRLDPAWRNFWLTRGGTVIGTVSDGTVTDPSGSPCTRFTPNSGAMSFPSVGRSPQTISLASGATTDIALSGYLYPSVAGSIALEPQVVLELNTTGASQIYVVFQIDPSTGTLRTKSVPSGVVEKSPLTIVPSGTGYRFEWVLTYTQDATLRNTVQVYIQARTTAGSGTYTSDGVAAIQYSLLSASFTSYIVPSTSATTADVNVPSFTFSSLLSTLGISLGSSYTLGVEYHSLTDAQEKVVVGMSSGVFADSLYFTHNNSIQRQGFSMISGGAAQLENVSGPTLSEVTQRAVVSVKANDSKASFNGTAVITDTACVLPVGMTTLAIGKAPWGGNANDFAGWISAIYLVNNSAVTASHLQSLSYTDLVLELGGQYILNSDSRRCSVPFNRAATVYEPQPGGLYRAYSGSQIPWSANGVQLDSPWQNSCLWGSEVNNARGWVVSANLTTDQNTGEVPAPASGVQYTRITTLGSTTPHVYRTLTVTPGAVMQMSLLVRLGSLLASEYKVAFYDAIAAAFISSEVSPTATVTANGWTRCDFTVTIPAGCTSARFYPFRNAAAIAAGKTVYVSLVNVTNTSYPVPLTLCEGTAVDVPAFTFSGTLGEAGVSTTGTSYSMFAEYVMSAQGSYAANRNVLQLDSNNNGHRSLLRWNNAAQTPRSYIVTNGATTYTGAFTVSEGTVAKHSMRVVADVPRSGLNGNTTSTTGALTLPTAPTHVRLGTSVPSEFMCGTLRRAAIFPDKALADKFLTALGTA